MQAISIDDITIPEDRQRTEFDEKQLEALADSIARLGLFHAVIVDAADEPPYKLRAGERRYRAIQKLISRGVDFQHNGIPIPRGSIPFTFTSDLSPTQLYEVELEENIQRVDLSWQDRALAMERLHSLHAARKDGASSAAPLTISEFAREVTGLEGPQIASFREKATNALTVAKHLHDPEVAAAKSQKEAMNIVKRKQQALLTEELNRKLAAAGFSAQQSQHVLINDSAFSAAADLPSNHFDLIVTDPPYGINMHTMNTQSGSSSGLKHTYEDSLDFAEECTTLVAVEGYRVTKASAACYMFCDIRLWARWREIFEDAGWYVWPFPVIWNKAPTGSILGSVNGPRHVYEAILYAIKGKKGVTAVGADVISIAGPSADKRHPAEKPVDLYSQLLSWSATPGDRIVDFFCGCGPVFPAATQFQCIATGIELDPAHAAIAEARRTSNEIL